MGVNQEESQTSPSRLVAFTWVFFFLGAALTIIIILTFVYLLRDEGGFTDGLDHVNSNGYLIAYVELVSAGLFPLLWCVRKRENWRSYFITKENAMTSTVVAVGVLMTFDLVEYVAFGSPIFPPADGFGLGIIGAVWYSLLAIFAYGPLEVFFVIWLGVKTDQVFDQPVLADIGEGKIVVSKGAVTTSILFGLAHIATTQHLPTFFYITAIFLFLSIVARSTGSAIGPMVAWTIYNNQVWYLVLSCFS